MKGVLGKYFDAIYVISLDHRRDRRDSLAGEMRLLGLADPTEVTWIRAVSGERCWAPGFFAAGAGAWGCLQSHLRVLQDAIMDGRESILVLEDDVTFHPRAAEMLELFFRQVPGDWAQIFLGGEHFNAPEPIKHRPFVLKAGGVHRTHAFAMKREVLPVVYQHIANYPDYMKGGEWHVDHQLGAAHRAGMWNTYTPSWWIAGQKGGDSNIAERKNPDYWWHWEDYALKLPFVHLEEGISGAGASVAGRVHFGNNLVRGSFEDSGLRKCVEDEDELRAWLALIAREAIGMGKLPGIFHGDISLQRVRSAWPGGALSLAGADLEELCDYPFNGLFPHALNKGKRNKLLMVT